MKNCPVCGQPVEEAWKACPHCGSPLGEEETGPRYAQTPGADPQGGETAGPRYAQSPGTGPRGGKSSGPRYAQTPGAGSGDYTGPYGGPAYSTAPTGWDTEPPTLRWARQTIRSPLYLVGAIGYTCMVLFTLASTFRTGAAALTDTVLAQLLGNVYWSSTWLDGLYNWLPLLFVGSVGSTLVGQLPNILVVAGLWMLYVSAADSSGAPLKTAGLSLIRGVQIFQLVMLGLMVLLLILSFFVMMAATGFYDMTSVIPVVLLFLVLVAVILGLVGFYYARLIATINGFRRTIWTGQAQGPVSLFVAVISALGGVLPLFGVLVGEAFATLASIGGAVAGIAFAILLFRCHDDIQRMSADPSPETLP